MHEASRAYWFFIELFLKKSRIFLGPGKQLLPSLKSEVTLGTYKFLDFESNRITFCIALELKRIRSQRIINAF